MKKYVKVDLNKETNEISLKPRIENNESDKDEHEKVILDKSEDDFIFKLTKVNDEYCIIGVKDKKMEVKKPPFIVYISPLLFYNSH